MRQQATRLVNPVTYLSAADSLALFGERPRLGCQIVLSQPGTAVETWPECEAPATGTYGGIRICFEHRAAVFAAVQQ